MEYYKKNGILDVTDCDIKYIDSLDLILAPALKNEHLKFTKVMLTSSQLKAVGMVSGSTRFGREFITEDEGLKQKYDGGTNRGITDSEIARRVASATFEEPFQIEDVIVPIWAMRGIADPTNQGKEHYYASSVGELLRYYDSIRKLVADIEKRKKEQSKEKERKDDAETSSELHENQ